VFRGHAGSGPTPRKRQRSAVEKRGWDDTDSGWTFDAEETLEFDHDDMSADEFAEGCLLSCDARRLHARRSIELAREELALRRALEDFPDD
jgi:hypothetical protein